jgi:tyrosine-protein phosphatase SIW14
MIFSKDEVPALPRFLLSLSFTLVLVTLSLAPTTLAQNERQKVEGVQNFGKVTELYLRGGAVTPDGVDRLASMGVKTIIDLRDKPSPGEPEACKRNGIAYYKFPMDGSVAPENKAINEILSIIQRSKAPVYVHCSAGKHRAGTIAALYRIRVQGWSKDRAWAEQQSYGFGPAEEHPALYAYVYGARSDRRDMSLARTAAASDIKGKSSKSKKDDDDNHKSSKKDDDEKDESSKKSEKVAKSKKDDGDTKVKVKSDKKNKKKDQISSESAEVETEVTSRSVSKAKTEPTPAANPARTTKGLFANASYITMADAIKRAKAEGGSGEILKVDLEWDEARSTATWDMTFSSGAEYEVDAASGKFLGVKTKAPAKLAALTPLALNDGGLLGFQEIIRKAETGRGQSVMEMELKRVRGRSETMFEVVLADGTALLYDAVTGKTLTDL